MNLKEIKGCVVSGIYVVCGETAWAESSESGVMIITGNDFFNDLHLYLSGPIEYLGSGIDIKTHRFEGRTQGTVRQKIGNFDRDLMVEINNDNSFEE